MVDLLAVAVFLRGHCLGPPAEVMRELAGLLHTQVVGRATNLCLGLLVPHLRHRLANLAHARGAFSICSDPIDERRHRYVMLFSDSRQTHALPDELAQAIKPKSIQLGLSRTHYCSPPNGSAADSSTTRAASSSDTQRTVPALPLRSSC